MSVTFAAEMPAADTRQFDVTCEDGQLIGRYTGYSLAYSEAQAHSLVCTNGLCQGYGADVEDVHDADTPQGVNMNSRNAMDVLRAIGLLSDVDDLCGAMEARQFIDLIGTALAVGVRDAALPTIDATGIGFMGAEFAGRSIDFGREAGYITGRLRELLALGEECLRLGVRVTWG